jgi:hypothetical protein
VLQIITRGIGRNFWNFQQVFLSLYRYIYIRHLYIYRKMELTENGNFSLFAAKQETETANFHLSSENGKRKFVFLGRQTINGNRSLLFQPTCSSMHTVKRYTQWEGNIKIYIRRLYSIYKTARMMQILFSFCKNQFTETQKQPLGSAKLVKITTKSRDVYPQFSNTFRLLPACSAALPSTERLSFLPHTVPAYYLSFYFSLCLFF